MNTQIKKRLPYEAPDVLLVRMDAACTLMQASLLIPTDGGSAIPDVEIIDINWGDPVL